MVVADEDVDPDEVATLVRVYAELTGETVDVEQVRDRARTRLSTPDPTAFPSDLQDRLDDELRPKVLTAAVAIAEADGFVLDEEEALLSRLALALGMSPDAHRSTTG